MNRDALTAQTMARYWHHKWKEALEAKDFDRAQEYFHEATQWKLKANISGPMSQNFDDKGAA